MIGFTNEYFKALAIFASFYVGGKILNYFLKNYAKKITEKTQTDLDDIILEIVEKPILEIITFIGAFLSLKSLSLLSPYEGYFEKLFFLLSVFVTAGVISKVMSVFVERWLKVQSGFEKTPQLLNKIVTVVIYVIAVLTVLGHYNIEITPLIATLGLGGLAVGLALQHTLTNLFAGLHILSDRPINVGDFIEVDSISGYVEDIGWRSTRIRTVTENVVIIPNGKLAESVITNDSMPSAESAVAVECGVSYESDLKKVESVTLDVAKQIQKSFVDYEPKLRFHTFADSNINFKVWLKAGKAEDRPLITHEFIKALKERYGKEGIEISWPVRKIVGKI